MSAFSKKLRECREAKGLSQKEPAKLLDISYSVIGKCEQDEMLPGIEAVRKIIKYYSSSIERTGNEHY
jgi:ribosome-binding protein aMBF1 (putative translation factor)